MRKQPTQLRGGQCPLECDPSRGMDRGAIVFHETYASQVDLVMPDLISRSSPINK